MARLESAARAGYFPTPPRVATAIGRCLATGENSGRHTVRLLDPCAGTGEAAMLLAQALQVDRYGIEINEERAEAARSRLDDVLATSAFSVRLANGAFSLLFLNPPYLRSVPSKPAREHAPGDEGLGRSFLDNLLSDEGESATADNSLPLR